MKIALVHNEYGKLSGEEAVVNHLADFLESKENHVIRFSRTSSEIPKKPLGSVQAAMAGVYNPFSSRAFAQFLDSTAAEIVHIHNLYPLISASILPECSKRKVPIVMTLHNFRLVCPNALLMRAGQVCHKCLGGREWNCVLNNCERNLAKSAGYAVRCAIARRFGLFRDYVSRFICLTAFQRDIFIGEGFPDERMSVIPNPAPEVPDRQPENLHSSYVGYVGRITPERDVPALLEAARMLPQIPFKLAGSYWRMKDLVHKAPANVQFLDQLDGQQMANFYAGTRLMAFATRCYEGFPMVLLEAMARGIPLVCTRIGGLPEIVEDERTGLLYEPGNSEQLAAGIKRLWDNPELARQFGEAGRQKALTQYSEDAVYRQLMHVYEMTRNEQVCSISCPKPEIAFGVSDKMPERHYPPVNAENS